MPLRIVDKGYQKEVVLMLFKGLPFAVLANDVLSLILVYLYWDKSLSQSMLFWLIGMLVVMTWRSINYLLINKNIKNNQLDVIAALKLFRIGVTLTSIIWACGAYLFYPIGFSDNHLILVMVLAGVTAGSIASLSVDKPSVRLFLSPILITLSMMFFIDGDSIKLALGAITLFYMLFLMTSAARIADKFSENYYLRKKLEDNEKKRQLLAGNLTDVIFLLDKDGVIQYVTPSIGTLLGVEDKNSIGLSMSELLHEADRDDFLNVLKHVTASYIIESIIKKFKVVDGSLLDMEIFIKNVIKEKSDDETQYIAIARDVTERRSLELENFRNKQLLESVLSASTEVAIIATDKEDVITVFNRGAERLLGYKSSETVNILKPYHFHLKEELIERKAELINLLGYDVTDQKVLTELSGINGSEKRDWTYMSKDQRYIPVTLVTTTIYSVDMNEIVGHVFIAQDISSRKLAEAALASEVEHKNSIINNMADGLITINEDMEITSINPAAENIFLFSAKEVIGQGIGLLMSENYIKNYEVFANVKPNSRKSKIFEVTNEFKGQRKDGEIFSIELSVTRIQRGFYVEYIGIVKDISIKKAYEKQLIEANTQSQRYLDTASVMLMSLDTSGRIDMLNRRGCQILGVNAADSIRKNWFDLCLPESDRDEFREYYNNVMSGDEVMMAYFQISVRRSDNVVRKLYLYATVFYNDRNEKTGVLLSGDDITDSQRIIQERKMLQGQLTQAHKMEAIGQLAGGIAHDFNNILAGIMGFSQLLQDQFTSSNDDMAKMYIDNVLQLSERARDLIAKMLSFSRQRDIKSVEPVALSVTVNDMLKLLRPLIPAGIEIQTELESSPAVIVDTVELQQLLMNLCINARDAMSDYGTLTIAVRKVHKTDMHCQSCHNLFSGVYTELSVSDTGTGISDETLQKIFDPFFTTKSVGKGTGMGLAVLHGIVHDRQGHIIVTSVLGKGTKFSLLFPIHEAVAAA